MRTLLISLLLMMMFTGCASLGSLFGIEVDAKEGLKVHVLGQADDQTSENENQIFKKQFTQQRLSQPSKALLGMTKTVTTEPFFQGFFTWFIYIGFGLIAAVFIHRHWKVFLWCVFACSVIPSLTVIIMDICGYTAPYSGMVQESEGFFQAFAGSQFGNLALQVSLFVQESLGGFVAIAVISTLLLIQEKQQRKLRLQQETQSKLAFFDYYLRPVFTQYAGDMSQQPPPRNHT